MEFNLTDLSKAYRNKKVLITGHTGFKGSWLLYWLKQLGADVAGYAHDPGSDRALFIKAGLGRLCSVDMRGNIEDYLSVREYVRHVKPDIIFHLAAQPIVRASYVEPLHTFQSNVMGTVNVLEAVRKYDDQVAVVVVTSDKCYENREWIYGYRENEPMGGHDPYSASKGMAELAVSSYRRSFFSDDNRVLVATARAGNVIGGGDWAPDRIVPDIMRAVFSGETPVIRNPGAIRPWQHVLEPLSGYLWLGSHLMMTRSEYANAWNFGPDTKDVRTVRDLARAIADHMGIVITSKNVNGPHEAGYLTLSTEKARAAGWSPRWDFNKAVAKTVQWYSALRAERDEAHLLSLMNEQIMEYTWTK